MKDDIYLNVQRDINGRCSLPGRSEAPYCNRTTTVSVSSHRSFIDWNACMLNQSANLTALLNPFPGGVYPALEPVALCIDQHIQPSESWGGQHTVIFSRSWTVFRPLRARTLSFSRRRVSCIVCAPMRECKGSSVSATIVWRWKKTQNNTITIKRAGQCRVFGDDALLYLYESGICVGDAPCSGYRLILIRSNAVTRSRPHVSARSTGLPGFTLGCQ
jgi:hypothetical protein